MLGICFSANSELAYLGRLLSSVAFSSTRCGLWHWAACRELREEWAVPGLIELADSLTCSKASWWTYWIWSRGRELHIGDRTQETSGNSEISFNPTLKLKTIPTWDKWLRQSIHPRLGIYTFSPYKHKLQGCLSDWINSQISRREFQMMNILESSRVEHGLIQALYKSNSNQPIYQPLVLYW